MDDTRNANMHGSNMSHHNTTTTPATVPSDPRHKFWHKKKLCNQCGQKRWLDCNGKDCQNCGGKTCIISTRSWAETLVLRSQTNATRQKAPTLAVESPTARDNEPNRPPPAIPQAIQQNPQTAFPNVKSTRRTHGRPGGNTAPAPAAPALASALPAPAPVAGQKRQATAPSYADYEGDSIRVPKKVLEDLLQRGYVQVQPQNYGGYHQPSYGYNQPMMPPPSGPGYAAGPHGQQGHYQGYYQGRPYGDFQGSLPRHNYPGPDFASAPYHPRPQQQEQQQQQRPIIPASPPSRGAKRGHEEWQTGEVDDEDDRHGQRPTYFGAHQNQPDLEHHETLAGLGEIAQAAQNSALRPPPPPSSTVNGQSQDADAANLDPRRKRALLEAELEQPEPKRLKHDQSKRFD